MSVRASASWPSSCSGEIGRAHVELQSPVHLVCRLLLEKKKVFICVGAEYPSFMVIPSESLNGVLSSDDPLIRCNLILALEFLIFVTPVYLARRVVVICAAQPAID